MRMITTVRENYCSNTPTPKPNPVHANLLRIL